MYHGRPQKMFGGGWGQAQKREVSGDKTPPHGEK